MRKARGAFAGRADNTPQMQIASFCQIWYNGQKLSHQGKMMWSFSRNAVWIMEPFRGAPAFMGGLIVVFGFIIASLGITILISLGCRNSVVDSVVRSIFDVIILYSSFMFLAARNFRSLTVEGIKEIGINHRSRYYPKHYITPKRWMRKLFDIKQRVIPQYLYFELFVSLFFLILGLLNIVTIIAVGVDMNIAGILFMSYLGLAVVIIIFHFIMSHRFKRK